VAATLQNEKSICAIGRDMVTTGRLHAEGCTAALEALSRFRMISDGLNVEHRDAVATAAARDASNGAEFIRRAEAAWGRPIRILAGEDEARIAAEGVVAGIPDADGLAAPLATAADQPDRGIERQEARRLVARSLGELPEPQRRVIELAYFGGLSQTEIAAELQEPLGTVKTRMRAAMEKLRGSLAPLLVGGAS